MGHALFPLALVLVIGVCEAPAAVLMRVEGTKNPRAAAHVNRAVELAEARRFAAARNELDQAIRMAPDLWPAYANRGLLHIEDKQWNLALQDLNQAIRIYPYHPGTVMNRATVYRMQRNYQLQLVNLENALKLRPNRSLRATIYGSLSWLRATCPDPTYRDGAKAVADAKRACDLSGWKNAAFVDDLAAAYAESGDFAAAVRYQQQALQLAQSARPGLAAGMSERLRLYQRGKPFRETTPQMFW